MCFVPAVKSSAVVLTIYRYRELGLVSAWSRSCKRKFFFFFFFFFGHGVQQGAIQSTGYK